MHCGVRFGWSRTPRSPARGCDDHNHTRLLLCLIRPSRVWEYDYIFQEFTEKVASRKACTILFQGNTPCRREGRNEGGLSDIAPRLRFNSMYSANELSVVAYWYTLIDKTILLLRIFPSH